jgi:RNA polymerase sigma-70 factor (ECF subfamily)
MPTRMPSPLLRTQHSSPADAQAAAELTLLDDESGLIARVRAGDVAAFEVVFQAYAASLCDFAEGYLRVRDAAEEVVQDVFLHLWVQRDEWPVRGRVRSYLYAATRNRALNVLRHAQTEARWEGDIAYQLMDRARADPADSVADAARAALERALAHAIARLPEPRRAVVRLRWVEGLSYTEVAEALGISIKAVDNHLARAIKALRATLEAYRAD